MTDPISDMITRIRNAGATQKETLAVPYSKIKEAILAVLQQKGFIKSVQVKGKGVTKSLIIKLLYAQNNKPRIGGLQRISKYSQRRYAGATELRSVKGGRGMYILTTPKGILADADAKKENVGGEVIIKIW